MKKFTPFPSICHKLPVSIDSIPNDSKKRGNNEIHKGKEKISTSEYQVLTESLQNSLDLTNEISTLPVNIPHIQYIEAITTSTSLTSTNLIKVIIEPDDSFGYKLRKWPVIIGGPGTEFIFTSNANYNFHVMPDRTPLLLRVAIPISHVNCDDSGIIDSSFWNAFAGYGGNLEINLKEILFRLVSFFKQPFAELDDDAKRDEWYKACELNHKKVETIIAYSKISKHPKLFTGELCLEWLSPLMRVVVEKGLEEYWNEVVVEEAPGIFSFDLFSKTFCDMLIEEVDSYEQTSLPRRRPNTMNMSGLIVNEIGLEAIMTSILELITIPLSKLCFKKEAIAVDLDHHHSFVVDYSVKPGKDLFLDMHHDSSEVTLNVCLGREFEGSGLKFCGQFGSSTVRKLHHVYNHKIGKCVLHRGKHRHGADHILSGQRMNLIIWARSSSFRNSAACGLINPDGYPKEKELENPDICCLSKSNDSDYEKYVFEAQKELKV